MRLTWDSQEGICFFETLPTKNITLHIASIKTLIQATHKVGFSMGFKKEEHPYSMPGS